MSSLKAKMEQKMKTAVTAGEQTGPSAPLHDRFAAAEAIVSTRQNGLKETDADPASTPGVSVPPSLSTIMREAIERGSSEPYYVVADIALCDSNPYNARHIYPAARVSELAESIAANGQDTPGTATIRNGRIVMASGETRRRAIKQAGLTTIKLLIQERMSDQQLYETSLRENDQRRPQTALDNALAWKKLIQDGIYANESELANKLGISLPNINKTLQIHNLPSDVMDIVRESPENFALGTLYELTLLHKLTTEIGQHGELVAMVNRVKNDEGTRSDVEKKRRELENKKDRAPRSRAKNVRHHDIQLKGENVGHIKEFDNGRLEIDIAGLSPEERAELVATVREKLKAAEFIVP